MKNVRKLDPKKKKTGAVIYVSASHIISDDQVNEMLPSLDDQESCCREYCASKKLNVLRVFREGKPSNQQNEALKFFFDHRDETSLFLSFSVWKMDESFMKVKRGLARKSAHAPNARAR